MEQTTALAPADQNRLLSQARGEVSRPRLPQFPTIKMRNAKSTMKDIKKGEFALVKNIEGEGGKSEDVTPLGPTPKIVILKRRFSYSYYDEDTQELVAWTNEIDRFAEGQIVKLAHKRGGKKTVRSFTWPEFKAWKEQADEGKKLTFRNVLYVCVGEPKIENLARLFVSNASVTGVTDGEKTGDYKHPLPGSFLDFEKPISWSQSAYFECVCELGSTWLEQNEYYLMTFKNAGPNESMDATLPIYGMLNTELAIRFAQDFGGDTTARPVGAPIEAEAIEVPTIDYVPETKVEDLPF